MSEQYLSDLIEDAKQCAAVRAFIKSRLEILYREQSSSLDEWNDAIDSAIIVVARA